MNSPFVPSTGLDFLVPWYDQLVTRFTREEEAKHHLLKRVLTRPLNRLLDVGCGSGTFLCEVAHRLSPERADLNGVDIDARMIEQARKKLSRRPEIAPSVTVTQANSLELPYPDGYFSHVTTSLLLHHLRPTQKCASLAEMFRVCAPGGQFLLLDFAEAAGQLARLRFLVVRLLDGWEVTKCNAAGLLPSMIAEAGFEELRETLVLATPLGTLRAYQAEKPA